MATRTEKGLPIEQPWGGETEAYLLRCAPASYEERWIKPLRLQIEHWVRFENETRESHKGLWSDCFPWIWDVQNSAGDGNVTTERTFESIEGFIDCMQTTRLEPPGTRVVLVCFEYDRFNATMWKPISAKEGIFSVVALALLGSWWRIANDTLFPVNHFVEGFQSTGKTSFMPPEGYRVVDTVNSLKLPSRRHLASVTANEGSQSSTDTLFLGITLTPPRFNEDFLHAFRSHHSKPHYEYLYIIRVRTTTIGQDKTSYIVVCSSQKLRNALKVNLADDAALRQGSPQHPATALAGATSSSMIRSFRSYVAERLCQNLDSLKSHLEYAKYIGRRDPSYSKLNYVIHLRDYLKMTKRFTSYLADDLPGPQNPIALDQSDAWSGDHEKYQCYLWTVITNLEKEVEQVYDTIRVQIDGKDGSRNILFAVLASLYLPFTLATGVFGMNIKEISDGHPQWSAVVALGLPLAVVTVALPLGFNSGYRKLTEIATRRPKAFRIMGWSLIAASTIAVVVTVVIAVLITHKQ